MRQPPERLAYWGAADAEAAGELDLRRPRPRRQPTAEDQVPQDGVGAIRVGRRGGRLPAAGLGQKRQGGEPCAGCHGCRLSHIGRQRYELRPYMYT